MGPTVIKGDLEAALETFGDFCRRRECLEGEPSLSLTSPLPEGAPTSAHDS